MRLKLSCFRHLHLYTYALYLVMRNPERPRKGVFH